MTQERRSRKFMITFWTELDLYIRDDVIYSCMCFDKCSDEYDNRFHGHAYLYFKNPITWKRLKEYFGYDAHIEIPVCNSEAINYIMNETHEHSINKYNRQEYGQRPMDNGKKKTVNDALALTKDEILELNTKEAVHILRIREALKSEDLDINDFHKNVKVYWIQGPSGCGKTERAKQIIRDNGGKFSNTKYENGFYSGVKNHKTHILLYDDFRDSHMKASEFINLIDYNKHTMNIKGGNVINDYTIIILTSVQHIDYIYNNVVGEPREQWMRRIEIIDMYDKNNECEDCSL